MTRSKAANRPFIWAIVLISTLITAFELRPDGNSSVRGPEKAGLVVDQKVNGIALTAPPRAIDADRMDPVLSSGADWVQIIPYAFSYPDKPSVIFDTERQWWGEKTPGIRAQVSYAKSRGLNVLLKPHIWVIQQGWLGEYELDSESDWQSWEQEYSKYILHHARLAEELGVEMFCVGTEAKRIVARRPSYWKGLIAEVRKVYSGQLTYASNWDNFQNIPFWADLDYIGIDAYFPLTQSEKPTVEEIKQGWEPHIKQIQRYSERYEVPVLFTEFGYLSVPQAAWRNWELESVRRQLPVDLQTQSNAFEGLFETFWHQDWFAGGFIWKWYYPEGSGGPGDTDYTPQGKPVMDVIRRYYN